MKLLIAMWEKYFPLAALVEGSWGKRRVLSYEGVNAFTTNMVPVSFGNFLPLMNFKVIVTRNASLFCLLKLIWYRHPTKAKEAIVNTV
jgi:hypothetical protein